MTPPSTGSHVETDSALGNLRILDLSTVLAAPVCATLLGDFGADVIKVEQPGRGDSMRWLSGTPGGRSVAWVQEARNKRSVTLDLRRPEAHAPLHALLAQCDGVVTNFRMPTLERWGIAPDQLLERHPHLVIGVITGYGMTGPYRDRGAFDRIAAAFSGQTYATGHADGPPVRSGYSMIDYMTAYLAAFAMVTALYHRDLRGGVGQVIDLALYEAAARATESSVAAYELTGSVRGRNGNRNPVMVPAEDFDAADGIRVSIHAGTPPLFARLTTAMGRPELAEDERFAARADLIANQETLYSVIADWVATLPGHDVVELLAAHDVPASAVMNAADIVADPHYRARGTYTTVDDADFGPMPVVGPLPRMSATPGSMRREAPRLGEHNDEVWGGIAGLADQEIRSLRDEGVI